MVLGCCLLAAVTKFQGKLASLHKVSSQDNFQICCADMYLVRFLANFAGFYGFLWILRDFADLCSVTTRNIRSPVYAHGLWLTWSCGHLSEWKMHLNMSTDSGQQWQWKTTSFPMNHPLSDQLKPWFNLWDLNWFNIHRKAFTKNPIRLYVKWPVPWNNID